MGGEGVETFMEIFDWVKDLSVWVMHWANTPYGGLALFVLAFCESSFFPIPPDVLLIALCMANSPMSFWYALICSLGSTLGGMLGYGIGRIGGRPLLERWVRAERINLVQRYYQRWDVWAVAVAGFTPIPYKVFTISAGAFLLNFVRFINCLRPEPQCQVLPGGWALLFLWFDHKSVHLPLFQYPQHSFYSVAASGVLGY